MNSILLSIHPSDPLWIAIAFVCGLVLRIVGLPPLIGFLIAGFVLHALGAEGGEFLNATADIGITLLLFSIGLKLKPQQLAKPEVWGVASIHMVAITSVAAAFIMLLAQFDFLLFTDLELKTALLLGFVLSFSSTVFAIKMLDGMGAIGSKHGTIAIGVLVIQDIAAVIFLAASAGKLPSIWAVLLVLLIPLRSLLYKILDKTGHGELLVLFGIVLALGGADIFELVGMKGDVGALIFGMLLAGHIKSNELAKALLSFKDLFLVGFFLSVGMTALPGWTELFVALFFIAFLPLKVALYFGLFNLFYLRASTSWRTSLNLANYSEFGLIVGAIAASSGWIPKEWLAVFAILLAISFILSAPLVDVRDNIYQKWRHKLKPFERSKRLSDEEDLEFSHVKAIIFGMGRMGSSAYNILDSDFGESLVGVEINHDKAVSHQSMGRRVIVGDATNPDFWTRASGLDTKLSWVLLTLPSNEANKAAAYRLRGMGYKGKIAAISKFEDEEQGLRNAGVDWTFNIYTEAGLGFADDLKARLGMT
ncbi:MAG: cation:proton antiporter [Gammaproteobacteria bacterium]|nr:cation:proton antiporter [Gammaproteobacteria bacterium]